MEWTVNFQLETHASIKTARRSLCQKDTGMLFKEKQIVFPLFAKLCVTTCNYNVGYVSIAN